MEVKVSPVWGKNLVIITSVYVLSNCTLIFLLPLSLIRSNPYSLLLLLFPLLPLNQCCLSDCLTPDSLLPTQIWLWDCQWTERWDHITVWTVSLGSLMATEREQRWRWMRTWNSTENDAMREKEVWAWCKSATRVPHLCHSDIDLIKYHNAVSLYVLHKLYIHVHSMGCVW